MAIITLQKHTCDWKRLYRHEDMLPNNYMYNYTTFNVFSELCIISVHNVHLVRRIHLVHGVHLVLSVHLIRSIHSVHVILYERHERTVLSLE